VWRARLPFSPFSPVRTAAAGSGATAFSSAAAAAAQAASATPGVGSSAPASSSSSLLPLSPSSAPLTASQRAALAPTSLTAGGVGGLAADEAAAMHRRYRAKLVQDAQERARAAASALESQRLADKERLARLKSEGQRERRLKEVEQLWSDSVIAQWGKPRTLDHARKLVLVHGIPPRLRTVLWPLALGADGDRGMTGEQFDLVQEVATFARAEHHEYERRAAAAAAGGDGSDSASGTGPGAGALSGASEYRRSDKAQMFRDIDVDLARTFPHLAFYQDGCPMKLQMRSVLDAYCFARPDVGYVQGMSYLVGKLLLYLNEHESFKCLAAMVEMPFFKALFTMDTDALNARYQLFEAVLRDVLPDLYEHLASVDIFAHGPTLYFVEWGMTLFSKRVGLDVASRLWDCFFLNGETMVYRAAVGLLQCLKPQLMGQPFEVILKVLSRAPAQVSEERLVAAIASIRWRNRYQAQLDSLMNQAV
jgi:hypothetical protein